MLDFSISSSTFTGSFLIALVKKDCLSRLGGDEFAVGLIVEKSGLGMAEAICDKIRAAIEQPIAYKGQKLSVGASIGMASYPACGDNVNVLMDIADKRMYKDKLKNHEKQKINNEKARHGQDIKENPVVLFFPKGHGV